MKDTTGNTEISAWEWLQEVRGLDAELLARMGVKGQAEVCGVPYI